MTTHDGKQWYFAYGSNLCIEQMSLRTGPMDEQTGRIARLPGHRLLFNMRGDDGQVYANLAPGSGGVIGVVYFCGEAALAKLDVYEEGYDRRRVVVTLENGETMEAMAYVARPEHTTADGAPSAEYLEIILRGARRHGLPEAYIASISNSHKG